MFWHSTSTTSTSASTAMSTNDPFWTDYQSKVTYDSQIPARDRKWPPPAGGWNINLVRKNFKTINFYRL